MGEVNSHRERRSSERDFESTARAQGAQSPARNGRIPRLFRADLQTERLSAWAMLAEGVGFEPTRGSAPTRSPGVRLRPLGHPSERARPYKGPILEATVTAAYGALGLQMKPGSRSRGRTLLGAAGAQEHRPTWRATGTRGRMGIPPVAQTGDAPGFPPASRWNSSTRSPRRTPARRCRPPASPQQAGTGFFSLPAPGSAWSAPAPPWAGTGAARRFCSWPRCARPRSPRTA